MPAHQVKLHLLAYDIADRKRLEKVHRTVRRVGIPLQYSVFLVPGTQALLDSLLAELGDIIVTSEDDIRVYTLPTRVQVSRLGRQGMTDGILLVGNGPIDQAISMLVDGRQAA
jgi:CRISPR-associated protein Cas2